MILNFNIGLLGHVDSGKTTLARSLSTIASTAAFDKNPQSKERGITLDLGFSAVQLENIPARLKCELPDLEQLQLTFVDCPGHASLIRTIIGGAQIIDLMILVVDAQKGIQTQTAECIVIGELLQRKLIVVVNKIDLLEENRREAQLAKLNSKLRKTLAGTVFGADIAVFNVSAQIGTNIQELLDGICSLVHFPKRDIDAPLLMYVDHCFSIKGQGTICTGTLLQGKVAVNDSIEIPSLCEERKVKSIQMFRRPVSIAGMGDRIGLCVTQFNAKLMERGVVTQPGYLHPIYAACIRLERIRYYKFTIKSKSKLHITVGHETVMANITLFKEASGKEDDVFDPNKEYEYVEEMQAESGDTTYLFVLLEFESAILAAKDSTLIASKLDLDVHSNCCRLAFWGRMQWLTHSNNYTKELLPHFKIFKRKLKQATVQRVLNEHQIIVQNLFKKQGNRDMYVGKAIELSTGEMGMIEGTFGQASKVKVNFPNGLKDETRSLLSSGKSNEVLVLLKFKKYIFNKHMGMAQ